MIDKDMLEPDESIMGSSCPKNNAADDGQKLAANNKPSRKAPNTPLLAAKLVINTGALIVLKDGGLSRPNNIIARMISNGPIRRFMYF